MRRIALPVVVAGLWLAGQTAPVLAQGAARPTPGDAGAAGRVEGMSFKSFVQIVHGADEQIQVQRLDEEIAREKVRDAEALYEPVMSVGTSYDSSFVLNSSNEILQRANQATYGARTLQLNTGVGMKIPTGADVEVSYNVGAMRNTLQPTVGAVSPEYRAWLGIKLTQPLLRDAGPEATNRGIRIAEKERDMSREAVRQVAAQRVVEGLTNYLAVQRSQERVRIRTQAAEVSRALLEEMRSQARRGQRSSGEVLDAEVAASQRQAQLQQARQELEEQLSDLQARLSAREQEMGRSLRPRRYTASDPLVLTAVRVPLPDLDAEREVPGRARADADLPPLFVDSLARRPESRFITHRLTRDSFEVETAENKTLPDLSFVGRWGIDDLNTANRYRSVTDYMGNNGVPYRSWSVGIVLKMPLYGDQKRQADLSSAKIRRQQTEIAQRAVQQRVINEVISSVTVLNRVLDIVEEQRAALEQQRRLVALDEDLLRQGRRSRVDLLKRQLETFGTEELVAENIMLANRASYVVSLARGEILSRLDLE